jgi:hypothetical protein
VDKALNSLDALKSIIKIVKVKWWKIIP